MDIPDFPCLKYGKEDTQTDLEYSIWELGVKENIILSKCPKDPTFRFELKTEGVKAVLAKDKKSVSLVEENCANGSPVFVIPPITILDASGITSEDAHYELVEENGMMVLSVCINPAWLSAPERIYPVTVDPQVVAMDVCEPVSTALTVRSDGNRFYTKTPTLRVGIDTLDYNNNLYLQLDFSNIPHGAIINNARLGFSQAEYLGNDNYNIYRITSPWTPENISWNNQPKHATVAMGSITARYLSEAEVYMFDVTEIAKNVAYGMNPNYGVVIKRDFGTFCDCGSSCNSGCDCPCNCRGYISFYSSLYENGDYAPLLQVFYSLPDDYVDHAEYTTFEAGLTGVAGINLHTGQLTYQYNEVSFSEGRLPLSFSHIFQSSEAENNPNTFYGRGWFPAQLQTLHPYDYGNYCAVYRDGQGKKHYFRDDFVVNIGTSEAQNHWLGDADGLGLICNPIRTQIRDEKDNVMTFENGNLKTLTDVYYKETTTIDYKPEYNRMTFDYDNLQRLKKITESLGRTVDLTYTSNRLFYLKDSENRSYRFIYDGTGHLVQILHPHTYTETAPNAPSTSFAYNGNRLVMITDTRGICHEIGYDEIGRVTTVKKTGTKKLENGVLVSTEKTINGGEMNITYYDNSTVVEDVKTGLRTVYRFDDCGHTTLTYEDVTNCGSISPEPVTAMQLFEYENLYHNGLSNSAKQDETMKSSGCYATLQADTKGPYEIHPNYLKNHKFIDPVGTVDPDKWIVSLYNSTTCCNGCTTTVPVGSTVVEDGFLRQYKGYEDYKAYKLDNTVYSSPKILRQELSMSDITIDGNVLVASLWVNATNVLPSQFDFFVKVTFKNGSPRVDKNITLERGVTGWQYLAMPIEIPEGDSPDLVRFTVKLANGNGSCIIFKPSLTETRGTKTKIDYNVSFEGESMSQCITSDNGLQKQRTYFDSNNDAVVKQIEENEETFTDYMTYENHQVETSETYQGLESDYGYNEYGFKNSTFAWVPDITDSSALEKYRIVYEPDLYEGIGIEEFSFNNVGTQVYHSYDDQWRVVKKVIDPDVVSNTEYEYNPLNDQLISVSYEEGNIENNFTYDPTNFHLTSISQNGFNYFFNYDCFGSMTTLFAGTRKILDRIHTNGTFDYVKTIYTPTIENSVFQQPQEVRVIYNAHGNPVEKRINNITVSQAEYDSRGNLKKVIDKTRNICYNYSYNKFGNIGRIEATDRLDNSILQSFDYEYDNRGVLKKTTESETGLSWEPIYGKVKTTEKIDPANTVVGTRFVGKFEDKTELDPFGRPTKHTLTPAAAIAEAAAATEEEDKIPKFFLADSYEYKTYCYSSKSDDTSDAFVVGNLKHEYRRSGETDPRSITWQYTYDAAGNVTSIISDRDNDGELSAGDTTIVDYTYDKFNRLISDNFASVEYDIGDNITKKTDWYGEYEYHYDTEWQDRISSIEYTRFEGSQKTLWTFDYDVCNNPTWYKNTELTWNNIRQMTGYGNNTFQYGADGIRCRKNNVHYTLDGSRILQEYHEDTGETLTFYYGEKGVFGFRHRDANGAENDYFYRKNLFGDVVAIYNANGQRIANYRYDAWGYHIPENDGNENLAIKNINPFRYRSYYYDTETCLYYLESRYYDPELCRFLNPDTIDYLGDGEELHNYNLFAYCGNNPIMYSDPTGHFMISTAVLIGAIIGGIVGATAGGIVACNLAKDSGSKGMKLVGWTALGILGGSLIGAAVGAAIGYGVGYLAGGTYANGLTAKSVSSGVKSFLSQPNKVSHVLEKSRHNLFGFTKKTMGKLMKKNAIKRDRWSIQECIFLLLESNEFGSYIYHCQQFYLD